MRRTGAFRIAVAAAVGLSVLILAMVASGDRATEQGADRARAADAADRAVDTDPDAAGLTSSSAGSSRRGNAAAAPPSASAAGQDQACNKAMHANFESLRRDIDPLRSPEDAIAHAMLGTMHFSADAAPNVARTTTNLLADAAKRWPGHADLAWLRAQTCQPSAGCEPDEAVAELVAADPDNAAAWLHAAAQARKRGDEAAMWEAMHRAARSSFHDGKLELVYLHVRPRLARLTAPPECLQSLSAAMNLRLDGEGFRDLVAFAAGAAMAAPWYGALGACRTHATPLSAAQRRDCIAVSSWLAQSDAVLDRMIGLHTLLPLADSERLPELREAYRELLWLQQMAPHTVKMPRFVARMQVQGEIEALRGIAVDRGEWPPPHDWLPSNPEQRALLLGDSQAPAASSSSSAAGN